MSIKKILTLPDPILRKESVLVEKVNDEIRKLLDDMLETMYEAKGIGLAAVQVGILKRLVVMDCSTDEEDPNLIKMINPEIIFSSSKVSELEEGCLSIPGFNETIARPDKIELTWQDIKGNKHKDTPEGLLTVCIQVCLDSSLSHT